MLGSFWTASSVERIREKKRRSTHNFEEGDLVDFQQKVREQDQQCTQKQPRRS